MHRILKACLLGGVAAALAGGTALSQQRVLTYYGDFDPAPLAAMEEIIADFEAENPDVDVQFQNFDHEGYKTSIRNFLSADAPDLANWYAGNRMAPFVKSGQFMDVTDVWEEHNLYDSLGSATASMTIDDRQWGVPYTYYQWGIYYNKEAYDKVGATVPKTWEEFIANCAKFKAADIDCLTTGTKALWPAAGIFDYMNLRTNGFDFHMDLTAGEVEWTDDRVKATFAEWAKLVDPGYITANHAALDWQDAASLLVQGKAANYVMGNFAVSVFKEGGMTNETLGFMPFPTINPGTCRAPRKRRPIRSTFRPAPRTSRTPRSSWPSSPPPVPRRRSTRPWASCRSTAAPRSATIRSSRPASSCCRRPKAASPSSSTATLRPRWPRSAWKGSSSSWCSPNSSTTS